MHSRENWRTESCTAQGPGCQSPAGIGHLQPHGCPNVFAPNLGSNMPSETRPQPRVRLAGCRVSIELCQECCGSLAHIERHKPGCWVAMPALWFGRATTFGWASHARCLRKTSPESRVPLLFLLETAEAVFPRHGVTEA